MLGGLRTEMGGYVFGWVIHVGCFSAGLAFMFRLLSMTVKKNPTTTKNKDLKSDVVPNV